MSKIESSIQELINDDEPEQAEIYDEETTNKLKNLTVDENMFKNEAKNVIHSQSKNNKKISKNSKKKKGVDFIDYAKSNGIDIKIQYEDGQQSNSNNQYKDRIQDKGNFKNKYPHQGNTNFNNSKSDNYTKQNANITNNESVQSVQSESHEHFNKPKQFTKNYNKNYNNKGNNYQNNLNYNYPPINQIPTPNQFDYSTPPQFQQQTFDDNPNKLNANKFDINVYYQYLAQIQAQAQAQQFLQQQHLYANNFPVYQQQFPSDGNSVNPSHFSYNNVRPFQMQMNDNNTDLSILESLEYYLSEQNLNKDFYIRSKINEEGFLEANEIVAFNKMRTKGVSVHRIHNVLKSFASEIIEWTSDSSGLIYLRNKKWEIIKDKLVPLEELHQNKLNKKIQNKYEYQNQQYNQYNQNFMQMPNNLNMYENYGEMMNNPMINKQMLSNPMMSNPMMNNQMMNNQKMNIYQNDMVNNK